MARNPDFAATAGVLWQLGRRRVMSGELSSALPAKAEITLGAARWEF